MVRPLVAMCFAVLLPRVVYAAPGEAVAALDPLTRRAGAARTVQASPAEALDPPVPSTPPVDEARSLLSAGDQADLDLALRQAGVDRAALHGGRETTNAGLDRPADRWRLPSAEAALDDPLWLPGRVGDAGRALSEDLGRPDGGWQGVATLAGQELGLRVGPGCPAPRGAGLVDAAIAWQPLSPRQEAWLHGELGDELDRVAGALLAQAAVARCRLDLALSGLSPEDRAAALTGLLATFEEEDGDQQPRADRALALATAWERTDRAALVGAGLAWTEAVEQAARALAALPAEAWPRGPVVVSTALGEVWIGSPGTDVMEGDPALVLDPGGGDHWVLAPGRGLEEAAGAPRVRAVVDLGGHDLYTGGAMAAGGALLGLSAGVDLAGDDTWRTGPLSQGAAWFGVSTWRDEGGDDAWVGPRGVQGFAGYGLAVLREVGGDDSLRAGAWAQGCAASAGVALLQDGGGDDRYVLGGVDLDSENRLPGHFNGYGQGFSLGQRPWLGGGVGWLQDDGGHDQYVGGLWVQGSSTWHGLGVLLDRAGNDLYTSDQYSQGSGIHLSAAGLFDLAGDDRYLTRNLGQGSGHDLSVSWLLDGAGDDVYAGEDTVQGVAITNGLAFLLDRGGDDLYVAGSARRHGYTDTARRHGAVAAFIDAGGQDRYLAADAPASVALPGSADPGSATTPQGLGVALDLVRPAPATAAEVLPPPPGPAPTNAGEARALLLGNQRWLAPVERAAAATDRLYQAGPQAVDWLLPLVSGELHLRSHSVGALLGRWAASPDAAGRRQVAAMVLASAEAWPVEVHDDSIRWHLRWLGQLWEADPAVLEQAVTAADVGRLHPAWAVRREAWDLAADLARAGHLPRILATTWAEAALGALETAPVPAERAAAARYLGAAGRGEAARPLVAALTTGTFELRQAAEAALTALAEGGHGTLVLRAVDDLARGPDGVGRDAALRIAGATDLQGGLALLQAALASEDADTRRAAARGLCAHDSPAARRLAQQHGRVEADPRVQAVLLRP